MGASEGDRVLLARKGIGYCQWVLGTERRQEGGFRRSEVCKKKDMKVQVTEF